jgi:hypothetical protein
MMVMMIRNKFNYDVKKHQKEIVENLSFFKTHVTKLLKSYYSY